jgi:hypothetical protein
MGLFSRSRRERSGPEWVRVAYARHQPEADMLGGLLAEIEVPVLIRRATMDVPEMLAGGPREILVPADRELEARALLDPPEPIGPDPDDAR